VKTLAPVPAVLALGTLALGTLTLGAVLLTATGGAEPEPTATVTVPAGAPAWTQGANPEWDFLAVIRTSGMDFTHNWEKDLASAGVDLGQVETFELRAQVCGSAMDDGEGGYHRASKTHGLWLSSFYDHVRRMGRDHGWNTPKTVAYHHCPSRFDAVNAVQALEARAKGH
jgi:hypothetical protein